MAKLKKIEEKKAKDEQAKDDLKAALISCLSEMSNDESPTKKRKTVTIAVTDAGWQQFWAQHYKTFSEG